MKLEVRVWTLNGFKNRWNVCSSRWWMMILHSSSSPEPSCWHGLPLSMHAETIITASSFSGDLCFLGYISGYRSKPGSLEYEGLNKTHELKTQRTPVSTASCFELHSTEVTDRPGQTTRVFLLMESIHTLTDHARWLIQRRLCVGSCRQNIMRKVLSSPDVSDRSTSSLSPLSR